jgi:thiamine-phosphate diphosphorylase
MRLPVVPPQVCRTWGVESVSKFKLSRPVLCLITDPASPDLIQAAEIALSAGVNMLQLRGHQLSAADMYALALTLRSLCQRYAAAFIVNDCVDVGLAVGAEGFQLGRRSLPLSVVHQLVGEDYLLGASVHSHEEAQAAVAKGADFLIAGTIFASRSHPGELPSGLDLLRNIKQALPTYPLLAIGGITPENAGQAMAAGADGVAVISAIFGATDIAHAVHKLCTAIGLQYGPYDPERK